jgi:hypothetical protein
VETHEKGPRIKESILNSDSDWRSSLRQFQESLAAGKLAPRWQASAADAMESRASGDYDDWKAEQYEEFWGQKQRLQSGVVASGSSRMKMVTLVSHGILKVGDVWSFTRAIRQDNGPPLLIEKEAKVRPISRYHMVTLVHTQSTADDETVHREVTEAAVEVHHSPRTSQILQR